MQDQARNSKKTRWLKVDYDDTSMQEAKRLMAKNWMPAKNIHKLRIKSIKYTVSSSHRGIHVEAKLSKPLHPLEMLLLQACMGSDPVRELLQWKRYKEGWIKWNVLFEEKL